MAKMSLAEMESLFGLGGGGLGLMPDFSNLTSVAATGAGAVGGMWLSKQIQGYWPMSTQPGMKYGFVSPIGHVALGVLIAGQGSDWAEMQTGQPLVGAAVKGAGLGLVIDGGLKLWSMARMMLSARGQQAAASEPSSTAEATNGLMAAPISVELANGLAGFGGAPISVEVAGDRLSGAPIEVMTEDQELAGIAVSY